MLDQQSLPRRVTIVMFAGLTGIAACGLVISAVAHVMSLAGARLSIGSLAPLFLGALVGCVLFLTGLIALRLGEISFSGLPAWVGRVVRWALVYLCVLLGYLYAADTLGIYGVAERDSMRPLEGALASAGCGMFYGVATLGFAALRESLADEA